jgi:hypothetical protein
MPDILLPFDLARLLDFIIPIHHLTHLSELPINLFRSPYYLPYSSLLSRGLEPLRLIVPSLAPLNK